MTTTSIAIIERSITTEMAKRKSKKNILENESIILREISFMVQSKLFDIRSFTFVHSSVMAISD